MSRVNVKEMIIDSILEEDIIQRLDEMGGTAGVPHAVREAEKNVQLNVLKQLSGSDNAIVMQLIELFGGFFRKVIKEFRAEGKVPNEEELLRYTAKYYGKDPIKVAREMRS